MTRSTDTGSNRTGISSAPIQARELLELLDENQAPMPPEGDQSELARMRRAVIEESEALGTVPPPDSVKGVATTAKEMLKGHKPTVFIDKLSERLAFERGGVRFYDAVLTKFDAYGTWDGGPSRAEIEEIRNEELRHFKLIHDCMENLGADPTAMTPSADLTGVVALGIMQAITDARTTLPQSLQALLAAERADIDGWSLLIELADASGQTQLADQFRHAHAREEEHARKVQSWVASSIHADLTRQLGQEQRTPQGNG